ncbi:MAG: hypothetical protein MZV64_20175 [Ignavibacteriales bacterium]|nr:hypothetical protein [Ignavibacteriales bacterium]
MGKKWSKKSSEIYRIEQDEFSLQNSLSKLSMQSEDITDVLLTHLHFDRTVVQQKILTANLNRYLRMPSITFRRRISTGQ